MFSFLFCFFSYGILNQCSNVASLLSLCNFNRSLFCKWRHCYNYYCRYIGYFIAVATGNGARFFETMVHLCCTAIGQDTKDAMRSQRTRRPPNGFMQNEEKSLAMDVIAQLASPLFAFFFSGILSFFSRSFILHRDTRQRCIMAFWIRFPHFASLYAFYLQRNTGYTYSLAASFFHVWYLSCVLCVTSNPAASG